MNKLGRVLIAAVFAGALALLNSCSDDGGTGAGTGTGTGTGSGGTTGGGAVTAPPPTLGAGCATSGADIVCVSLSAAASSLAADNSSFTTITGTLTRNGAAFQGAILNFTLSPTTMGSLTAASGVTNAAGVATTTFQAGGTIGAVGVSVAHSGSSATSTLALSLTQAPGATPAGIQFVSATPSVLGVVGSGQQTTSAVIFKVTDTQGGPIPNQTVNFTLVGPTGAYIGTVDGSPTTATGTTNSLGNVMVPLNAGNVAGPVTITATVSVSGTIFTTSTSVISIGGAVPSARHFTLGTARFNLPGLVRMGFETQLSVLVADRFSNYNILSGTQVSFYTEAGAVDASVNLDDTGAGTVTFRTQNPLPYPVAPALPPNPRNGWVTVIAVTRGEEEFVDINGNGVYDAGVDTFTTAMDLGEPFVDGNDNRVWDGPGCTQTGCDPTHPGELFVDANTNGRYDGPNSVWDGPGCSQAGCNQSPTIWKSILLQFTGNIVNCNVTPASFDVANGGLQNFLITISDQNNNVPVPGTTVTISLAPSSSGARVEIGTVIDPILDGISAGPFVHQFTLADGAPNIDSANANGFTIRVTPPACPASSGVTCTSEVAACSSFGGSGVIR